jgi:hypothetical protein
MLLFCCTYASARLTAAAAAAHVHECVLPAFNAGGCQMQQRN